MARHAQPREVAELKGATRKNPQRYRNDPPVSDLPLGEAPGHLTEAEAACWFELETYAPRGVLKGADRLLLEMTSVLLSEFRDHKRDFSAAKFSQLVSCLARLGMSPADRQKLGATKPADGNEFDEF